VSAPAYAPPQGDLLFNWERPRRRQMAIAGFLVLSTVLHALGFYIFQIVYPPPIALLPPPAQVSLIAPTTPEATSFLNWLNAEDPALAAQTQRPADARAFQLPRLAHVPSYVTVKPKLKDFPLPRPAPSPPSAMPPEPVPVAPPATAPSPLHAPTILLFSNELRDMPVTHPELKFHATTGEAPESARFRIAVDSSGTIRYAFLEQSSGDATLDEEARQYLALTRFQMALTKGLTIDGLLWTSATFVFGNDLQLPRIPTEPAP
jgi:outer membrane biosynthesis protein TonB